MKSLDLSRQSSTKMLIAELARQTGVSKDAVRLYERKGLLKGVCARGDNGYLHFSDAAVERVGEIKTGQDAGLSLGDISVLIEAWYGPDSTDTSRLKALKHLSRDIHQKITTLSYYADALDKKISTVER